MKRSRRSRFVVGELKKGDDWENILEVGLGRRVAEARTALERGRSEEQSGADAIRRRILPPEKTSDRRTMDGSLCGNLLLANNIRFEQNDDGAAPNESLTKATNCRPIPNSDWLRWEEEVKYEERVDPGEHIGPSEQWQPNIWRLTRVQQAF